MSTLKCLFTGHHYVWVIAAEKSSAKGCCLVVVCERCGKPVLGEVQYQPHSFTDSIQMGCKTEHTCSICGWRKEEEDHDFEYVLNGKDEGGCCVEIEKCIRCGTLRTWLRRAEKPHDFLEPQPSEDDPCVLQRRCRYCGYMENAGFSHDWKILTDNACLMERKCRRCGEKQREEHHKPIETGAKIKVNRCEILRKCERCGVSLESSIREHSFSPWSQVPKSTCLEERHCTMCGAIETHETHDDENVNTHSHTYERSGDYSTWIAVVVCKKCGRKAEVWKDSYS